jgi:hypothetical protein
MKYLKGWSLVFIQHLIQGLTNFVYLKTESLFRLEYIYCNFML